MQRRHTSNLRVEHLDDLVFLGYYFHFNLLKEIGQMFFIKKFLASIGSWESQTVRILNRGDRQLGAQEQ